MQRIPHDKQGTWIQQFKYINNNPDVKRYYLNNASFLVYSIVIEPDRDNNTTRIVYPSLTTEETIEIKFGQFVSPQRNLQLFKRFYFDLDISFNRKGRFNSFPEEDDESAIPVLMKDQETVESLATRANIAVPPQQFTVRFPRDFYKIYLGYNHIRNFTANLDPINKYEAIVSDVLATIGEDCFTWIEIIDNELDLTNISETYYKSSALMLDYKIVIDKSKLEEWFTNTFPFHALRNWVDVAGTTGFEFNFMLYPPIASGMQIEDLPRILSPNGVLKKRLIEDVTFNISRSFVDSAQKVFEIIFTDNITKETLYKANSLDNFKDFTIKGKDTNITPEYLVIENSIFEELSGVTYPSDQFKVVYTMPNDLRRFLSAHLNYTITVRVTDLTSERRL